MKPFDEWENPFNKYGQEVPFILAADVLLEDYN